MPALGQREPSRVEGMSHGFGRGRAGEVAAGARGTALSIAPRRGAACPLPAPGRVVPAWEKRQSCLDLAAPALPRWEEVAGAFVPGSSQCLGQHLLTRCAPAGGGGGGVAVRGLHPCWAATCQDRAESAPRVPGENRPQGHLQQLPPGHPSGSPGVWRPSPGTQVTLVAEPRGDCGDDWSSR